MDIEHSGYHCCKYCHMSEIHTMECPVSRLKVVLFGWENTESIT
jgi:hypothetical protein